MACLILGHSLPSRSPPGTKFHRIKIPEAAGQSVLTENQINKLPGESRPNSRMSLKSRIDLPRCGARVKPTKPSTLRPQRNQPEIGWNRDSTATQMQFVATDLKVPGTRRIASKELRKALIVLDMTNYLPLTLGMKCLPKQQHSSDEIRRIPGCLT